MWVDDREKRCIIATGTTQQPPMVPDLNWTEEQYKECLRQNQQELKEAKEVVMIGGGSVGIEFAGVRFIPTWRPENSHIAIS